MNNLPKKFILLISSIIGLFSVMVFIPNIYGENLVSHTIESAHSNFFPDSYSDKGIIVHSLPGYWRPFSDDSPWNTPIPANTEIHPDSHSIIAFAVKEAKHIRLARIYTIPVWIVNVENTPLIRVRSDKIFDTWDKDRDGWSDVSVPITEAMWAEPTSDGHLCVIDPFKMIAWEFSRFDRMTNGKSPRCTTFNIWNLTGAGIGNPFEGDRWWARGGRGAGFPLIAGLIRPEELEAGVIRHALVFTFPKNRLANNRADIFLPPACRSDGKYMGKQYPIEGMRFQLDPSLTENDLDNWGLNREGKIVARALQSFGMFLGDNGGAMALQAQLLAPSKKGHRKKWEALFPGFYKNIQKIPTNRFRVVYTGVPIIKK